MSSESALLSDAVIELLETVSETERKLKRLVMAAGVDMPCAIEHQEANVAGQPLHSASNPGSQVEIDPRDIAITTYRSRKGGQWAHIADNGVTIKHLPTGIAVSCDEIRSAHANRALAMKRLLQILASLPCDQGAFEEGAKS